MVGGFFMEMYKRDLNNKVAKAPFHILVFYCSSYCNYQSDFFSIALCIEISIFENSASTSSIIW